MVGPPGNPAFYISEAFTCQGQCLGSGSQVFGFLDPDPQKYVDPRIRIQGAKYQPKNCKKKHLRTLKIQI